MLALANERVALTIRPDLGGRIEDLVDRRTGRTWLWHPDGYQPAPRTLPVGAAFPYVWLFQTYGRWRGHYVVVVEPATTMPYDLHTALARGTCAVLAPRSTRELDVTVSLTA